MPYGTTTWRGIGGLRPLHYVVVFHNRTMYTDPAVAYLPGWHGPPPSTGNAACLYLMLGIVDVGRVAYYVCSLLLFDRLMAVDSLCL